MTCSVEVPMLGRAGSMPTVPLLRGVPKAALLGAVALISAIAVLMATLGGSTAHSGAATKPTSAAVVQAQLVPMLSSSVTSASAKQSFTTSTALTHSGVSSASFSDHGYSWCAVGVTAAVFGVGAFLIGILADEDAGIWIAGRYFAPWLVRRVQYAFSGWSAMYGLVSSFVC